MNCLETRPNWMAERKDILGPLMMNKIFLPGTHDSASYAIHERAGQEKIIEKYVITQVKMDSRVDNKSISFALDSSNVRDFS